MYRSMMVQTSLVVVLLGFAQCVYSQDWPCFRGPTHNGHAAGKYPTEWGPGQNIQWKIQLPGLGNSSPIVIGDQVFVAMAEEKGKKRSLRSYDRKTGKPGWFQVVEFDGKEPTHDTNPYAGSTPASDGKRVVIWHGTPGLFCYDLAGKELWKLDLGPIKHIWGFGSSPVIHDGFVYLNAGPGASSFVIAVDLATGKEVWRVNETDGADNENPKATGGRDKWIGSWATPVVARIDGTAQLVVSLPHRMQGFDLKSGKSIWTCQGFGTLAYTDAQVGEGYAIGSGGYGGPIFGLSLGGEGDITEKARLWRNDGENPQRIGSGIILDQHFYIVNENGVVQCVHIPSGQENWKARLPSGGGFWASTILADGKLYAVNQTGKATVFAASPSEFKLIAENNCEEGTNATPAFSQGQIFYRSYSGLMCIGAAK
jgi:outer membrane protein assembly factor BamB